MNKFVKTIQKLTALFIIFNAMPREAVADKVGQWHSDGCNSGVYQACIRFPGTLSTFHYPNHSITTKRYLYPRDNPVSTTQPIDMKSLINDLGGKKEISMDTYYIPRKGLNASGNVCFQATLRVDSLHWNIVLTDRGTAFQLKKFPLLGFIFRVKTALRGAAGYGPKAGEYSKWHNVDKYQTTFNTACSYTAELGITPVMEITPIDLSKQVSDFSFSNTDIGTNGEFRLDLENTFWGAFSLEGRSSGGLAPKVTNDGGTTISGRNVVIRLYPVTCIIDTGSAHQTQDFGVKKSSQISTAVPITGKDVSIGVNCGANAYIRPWIVFTDSNKPDNRTDKLTMVYQGDRSKTANVAIKLKLKDGNYIKFGPDSPNKGTQHQFQLTRDYQNQNYYSVTFTPELLKLNEQKVEGGKLEALSTYTLSYQ